MTDTTRRRWTPITEEDLDREWDEAIDDVVHKLYGPHWPKNWWRWRIWRAAYERAAIVATKETTQ
jgi:hypothetical protein